MDILKYVISGVCNIAGHLFHGEGEKFLSLFNKNNRAQSSSAEREPAEGREMFNISVKKLLVVCLGVVFCCGIIGYIIFFSNAKSCGTS